MSLRSRVRHLLCGLFGGHDDLWKFTSDRKALECAKCGRETPGWAIDVRRHDRISRSRVTRESRPTVFNSRVSLE